jgi:hypothetical protein
MQFPVCDARGADAAFRRKRRIQMSSGGCERVQGIAPWAVAAFGEIDADFDDFVELV